MPMDPIAWCESCGEALYEGDDYDFISEGIVWVCRPCVEVEEDRLRDEFGWLGAWTGDATLGDRSPGQEPG